MILEFFRECFKGFWNLVWGLEPEELVIYAFRESNRNFLLRGTKLGFIARILLFSLPFFFLRIFIPNPALSILALVLAFAVLALLSLAGYFYFIAINRLARSNRMGGIFISVILLFLLILIL
ncbi:MAG: hypothetical protein NTV63_02525 [Candidatus Woesearchaeota archaeon]|nr:hypothetical protein [Candidatus Woesearchaeota archaeon]